MKRLILLTLTSLMTTSCYKEDLSYSNATASSNNSGNNNISHYCGYSTKDGKPCKRLVAGSTGYCRQHK